MARAHITIGDISVTAAFNDSNTARPLLDALPFESKAQIWGAEVYFSAPVETEEENTQADVPFGAVAYWPVGQALCLFFGQRPYSPVNVVGEIEDDAGVLASVSDGDPVRVEPALRICQPAIPGRSLFAAHKQQSARFPVTLRQPSAGSSQGRLARYDNAYGCDYRPQPEEGIQSPPETRRAHRVDEVAFPAAVQVCPCR